MEARCVLVVDDDEGIRAVAQRSLEHVAGFNVDLASDGTEARRRLSDSKYDAVLVDVLLGAEDGLELVEWIARDLAGQRPLVFLFTAGTRDRCGARDVRCIVAGVIEKPFDPIAMPLGLMAQLEIGDVAPRNEQRPGAGSVRDDLEELWTRHQRSVLRDLDVLADALRGLERSKSGSPGSTPHLATALEVAHRLHGALGVYGLEEESSMAAAIQSVLRWGPAAADIPGCESVVRELRFRVRRPLPRGE